MGLRRRLILALVGLVALTALAVGALATLLAERTLRTSLVDSAVATTEFNLTVLSPAVGVGESPSPDVIASSNLLDRFLTRGPEGVRVEFEDGSTQSNGVVIPTDAVSDGLRAVIDRGEIAFEFVDVAGQPYLLTGGRLPPSGPVFVFAESSAPVANARTSLLATAAVAALVAAAVGSVAAVRISSQILTPVAAASEAAHRMAAGDLDVRLAGGANDELGRLNASFNSMARSLRDTIEELESATRREQRFVADVAHELKTPITGLVNGATLLNERLADNPGATSDERSLATLLDTDSARLRRLVDDLLEISRTDLAAPPRLEEVDLQRFLADLTRQRLPGTSVTSSVDTFRTDRRSLERIVGNLLDNARIHAVGTGVEIDVSSNGPDLVLEVSDRGPGVPDAQVGELTTPFRTLDEARSSGAGLGLAIALRHAGRLGGSLTLANRDGGGLRVTVRLPNSVAEPLHDGELADTGGRHSGDIQPEGDHR